jgi:hypothetical protein
MTVTYTNIHNINPIMAAWLVNNNYSSGDKLYPDKRVISATTLLKPVRQYVLGNLVKDVTMDISDLVALKLGTSVHDSIEKLWTDKNKLKEALLKLNYSEKDIESINVNGTLSKDKYNLILEQRFFKELNDIIISGQVDMIAGGQLIDFKTTSTYTYKHGTNDEKYKLQGSIYKWLIPDIITENTILIQYVFTDWQAGQAKLDPDNYPPSRVIDQHIELYSLEEIEEIIINKFNIIKENESLPNQDNMIRCTDDDLWLTPPDKPYRYYSDPTNTSGKSTKNFADIHEANQHLISKGKGTIIVKTGVPKACLKCRAFTICKQREEYFDDMGILK